MSMENANTFVKKLFGDDEFIKEFYKNGGIKKDGSDKEKNDTMINTANKMGYDIDEQEFKKATEDYFAKKGTWGTIKTFMHFNKVIKSAEKEGK
ncbi:MAG: hypothetical protein IKG14_03510 [Clostridia bacterium]|nr:hypothetical protein [Clostridia bacterium]